MKNFFNKSSLIKAINSIDTSDMSVFVLTDKFQKLSLSDTEASQSSTVGTKKPRFHQLSTTESIIDRFKLFSKTSTFTRNLMEQTKVPFIDIPNSIMQLTAKSSKYVMSLGFRFLPGQETFLSQNLSLPDSDAGLKSLRDKIGLTLSRDSLSRKALMKLKTVSDSAVDKTSTMMTRVLVEAITFNDGYYGRFIILVQLGLGCTVWYGFAPGDGVNLPVDGLTPLFNHIDCYESFIQSPDLHSQPGFNKITLVEGEESPIMPVCEAFFKEKPFVEIQIPNAKGLLLMGVTLGLSVAVILAFGISPNSGEII